MRDQAPGLPQYPDVTVRLDGEDGNVYAIVGRVGWALKRAGYRTEVRAFYREAQQCRTYDAVLELVRRTVEWT